MLNVPDPPEYPSRESLADLDWFASEAGQAYCQAEASETAAVLSNIFGYHGLQIATGASLDDPISASQMISCHRLYLHDADSLTGDFLAAADALPLATESIQLVVAQHIQHWCDWTTVLDELERILSPNGVLVVCALRARRIRRQLPSMTGSSRVGAQRRRLVASGVNLLLIRPVFASTGWNRLLARLDRLNLIPGSWLARFASGYLLVGQKNTAASPIMRVRRRSSMVSGKVGSAAVGQLWYQHTDSAVTSGDD